MTKTFFSKKGTIICIFVILVLAYLLLRLVQIRTVPMFLDEAIYSRWAQLGKYNASQRLVSLSDGKQPLYIWITSLSMNWISHPLYAGRIVSILSGLVSMLGLFFLSVLLFENRSVGFLSMLFYILYPHALILDRMALYESLVGALTIWILNLSILITKTKRIQYFFILAHLLGASLLTKSSAYMHMLLLSTNILLINFKKKYAESLIKIIVLLVLSIILAHLYSSVLLLSSDFSNISEKNSIFVYQASELLSASIFTSFWKNLFIFTPWVFSYITIPVVILVVLSFFFIKSKTREKILLILWFVIPFVSLALIGKLTYPRYIFFMTLPLLPLASISVYSLSHYLKKSFVIILFIVSFGPMVIFDYKILSNYASAPLPQEDQFQYISGWPSGWGIPTIVKYLQKESQNKQILILAEGTYGSLAKTSMEIFFGFNPLVKIEGLETGSLGIDSSYIEKAQKIDTYLITNETQTIPSWPLTKIIEQRKGNGDSYIRLYKFITTDAIAPLH